MCCNPLQNPAQFSSYFTNSYFSDHFSGFFSSESLNIGVLIPMSFLFIYLYSHSTCSVLSHNFKYHLYTCNSHFISQALTVLLNSVSINACLIFCT